MNYAKAINFIEDVSYVIGMLFYSFMLYCMIFRTKNDLGKYRYLQIIMVTVDALYTTGQMFIRERIITAEGVYAMVPTSVYHINAELLSAYLALYTLTFVMVDYSFLYRLWAVRSPTRIHLFSNPLFILLLIALASLETIVWFSSIYFLYLPTESGRRRMREAALTEYRIDMAKHVMIMGDYYQEDGSFYLPPVIGLVILCGVMTISFGFMAYAFLEIFHYLRVANNSSKKTTRMQRQLFITLCWQAVIPLVTLYAPCGFVNILPMFHLDPYFFARATPPIVSCFLPLDTLAVLLSMGDYRREIIRVIRCRRSSPSVVSSTLRSR